MESNSRPADSYRPPPTAPPARPKKRARREGPPGPPPTPPRPLQEDGDGAAPHPPRLGGYVIQSRPHASPGLQIRGRSTLPPKPEAYHGEQDDASLPPSQEPFCSALDSIRECLRDKQLAYRVPPHIHWQLNRLADDYRSMIMKAAEAEHELREAMVRENALRMDLEDSRTAAFKLTCAKKDLTVKVDDLKAAVAEAERERDRAREEAGEWKARHGELDTKCKDAQSKYQKAVAEKVQLECALQERDAEARKLASEQLAMQRLVQERDAELAEAKAENVRLQGLIRQREAEISSLTAAALPTPVSPLVPLVSFPIPGAPPITQDPLQGGHSAVEPPRSSPRSSPAPFIKQEAPDQGAAAATGAAQASPTEQPQDAAQQLYHLGAGLANILGKVFGVSDCSTGCKDAVVDFIARLGAAPAPTSINTTPAAGFWELKQPWTVDDTPPSALRPTVEEQFTHLCLLLPLITGQDDGRDHAAAFRVLTELISSLIKADHASSPQAGLAFLETMATVTATPDPKTKTLANHINPAKAMLAVMLCELCRALEHTFPDAPRCPWDMGNILGPGWCGAAAAAVEKQPLGWLASALCDDPGRMAGAHWLRDRLAATCGDRFCAFLSSGLEGADKDGGESRREMGLLYCGGPGEGEGEGCSANSSPAFVVVDFTEKSFRLVDCRLAAMAPNASEPRKLDLTVSRDGVDLFRVLAAPRDVAAFWVKYAMGDI